MFSREAIDAKYFTVEDAEEIAALPPYPRGHVVIECKRCPATWTWSKDKPLSTGARLQLLNHARAPHRKGGR